MVSKRFNGFPDRAEVTPIPTVMISAVMQDIGEINEIKVILHIFRLLAKKKGYPRFLTFTELSSDAALLYSLTGDGQESKVENLQQALIQANQHGVILNIQLKGVDGNEDIYLINNDSGKKDLEKIEQGEIILSNLSPVLQSEIKTTQISNIFSLYEQNIGVLTPIIAEELQEAERLYPPDWIENAFKEAVELNKRSWRYISRILERWAIEGKDDGKPGGHTKKEKSDPDRYIRGKYGHMVQR